MARLLSIGRDTIYRWTKQERDEGNLNPRKIPGRPKTVNDNALKEYVKQNPDKFLREIADVFKITKSGICRAFKRLNITRKKKTCHTKKQMNQREKYTWII